MEFLSDLEKALHHGNAPVAVALTDLDGFAGINDTFGSDAGDRVLAAWERLLDANVTKVGAAYRLGGDEYAVVLPGMSAENALVLLDEIRTHFAERRVDGVDAAVSASVGVASQPPHGSTAEELFRASGEALMRAKRDGRDRVALYVEEKMTLKSNYYSRANLDRLAKLSTSTSRTEASLLREALDDLLEKYRDAL
ncbi:MAG TPA: GGDEF domain-containing protein [Acidimicrobiales bacterium]|nr:GGDEF domain-containing protein [Acidimicrobiales bacterium]